MKSGYFHQKFSLNGVAFATPDNLLIFSKTRLPSLYPFLENWFDANEHISVKTSGSTGNAKTIQLKKDQMFQSAMATGAFFKLTEGSTALLCLSPEYIAGKMMLVRAMVLGLEIDVDLLL